MAFDGAIESFSSGRISGWARYRSEPDGATEQITIRLAFRSLGGFNPTKVTVRPGGSTGFTFVLPTNFQQMPWHSFLDEFDAVYVTRVLVTSYRWPVPFFYKTVLGAFDPDNRTAVLADRRRQYSFGPKPGGRLAALTIAFNEHSIVPLWAKYYASLVGAENVFIIDQGSDRPYTDVPQGVTVIRLPRESFDNWLIMRLVATFQRHLLESYDAVLYADSDEFLCVDPDVLRGLSVKEFLLGLPDPIGITRGYNLHHDILNEAGIDPARPILEQRRLLTRERSMDKPMISRIPLNWVPGFHDAREGGTSVDGMFMLHLRWHDMDTALRKAGRYRESKWDPYDVKNEIASYQRATDDDIVNQFRQRASMFGELKPTEFDNHAEVTVLPKWMASAVWI